MLGTFWGRRTRCIVIGRRITSMLEEIFNQLHRIMRLCGIRMLDIGMICLSVDSMARYTVFSLGVMGISCSVEYLMLLGMGLPLELVTVKSSILYLPMYLPQMPVLTIGYKYKYHNDNRLHQSIRSIL